LLPEITVRPDKASRHVLDDFFALLRACFPVSNLRKVAAPVSSLNGAKEVHPRFDA
jgi:hypothetical protein